MHSMFAPCLHQDRNRRHEQNCTVCLGFQGGLWCNEEGVVYLQVSWGTQHQGAKAIQEKDIYLPRRSWKCAAEQRFHLSEEGLLLEKSAALFIHPRERGSLM